MKAKKIKIKVFKEKPSSASTSVPPSGTSTSTKAPADKTADKKATAGKEEKNKEYGTKNIEKRVEIKKIDEKKRKKILWISVISITAIIFFFWIYNFSYNIKMGLIEKKSNQNDSEATEINAIKEQIKNIKNSVTSITEEINTESNPPAGGQENNEADIINEEELKKRLEEIIATSTEK